MHSFLCLLLLLCSVQCFAIIHRPRSHEQALNIPTDHAVFDSAFDRSISLSYEGNVQPIKSSDDQSIGAYVEALIEQSMESDSVGKQPKTCAPCVMNGTKHIIEELWKAKIEECKNKTGKRAEWCQWIKDHPKFYTGFLFAKYHPVYQSFLYCSGAEKCKIHGGCNSTELFDSSEDFEEAQQADAARYIVKAANVRAGLSAASNSFESIQNAVHSQDWLKFNEHSGRRIGRRLSMTHHAHQAGQCSTDRAQCMSGKCSNCLKLTIEAELAADFVCIEIYCEKHSGDPKIAKMCKCIQKNMAFTAGYLYGYTQPYKFATGYCLGAGTCSVSDFMHGNRSMA